MSDITRRQFVKGAVAVGAASTVSFPSVIRAQGLNEKLQVGFVAVGGRADAHTSFCHGAGLQCIAFAEVDKTRWGGVPFFPHTCCLYLTDAGRPIDDLLQKL